MRRIIASAAAVLITCTATSTVLAKAHSQPSDKADFGQRTAAAAIAKNDKKSGSSSSTSTKSSTTTPTKAPTNPKR
jgi:hypothetical protein